LQHPHALESHRAARISLSSRKLKLPSRLAPMSPDNESARLHAIHHHALHHDAIYP
jgi:hypothetical protein